MLDVRLRIGWRTGPRVGSLLIVTGLLAWPLSRLLLEVALRPSPSGGTLLLGAMALAESPSDYLNQAVGFRILISGALTGLGLLAGLWPSLAARRSQFAAVDQFAVAFAIPLAVLLAVIYLPAGIVWYPSHDFLDSEFVYKALRGGSPGWFDLDHVIQSLMGGIPLSAFGFSDLNPLVNLYVVLDPFLAFSLSEIVARLVGFVGMYLLISRHLLAGRPYPAAIPGSVGFLFALLPFWEHMTPTIAFQPLHVVAILALRSGSSPRRWLPIATVYPLVADGLRGGILVVGAPILMATWDIARGRRAEARNLVLPSMVTTAIALVGLIRPAHLILATDFVSHRTDWPIAGSPLLDPTSAGNFLRELTNLLTVGQYHMGGGPLLVPLIATALLMIVVGPSSSLSDPADKRIAGTAMGLVIGILAVSVLSAAEEGGLTNLAGAFPIPLRVSRVIALAPMLWMLMLALSMERLAKAGSKRIVRVLLAGTVLQASLGAFGLLPKLTAGRVPPIGTASTAGPPSHMRDYYRAAQFEIVVQSLGEEATVVSFDIDPMIAAFHGISTLDGYSFNYPLEHKQAFRAIIEGELDRDPELQLYFDAFGSRAYLFFTERESGELYLNFCASALMGATHVIARNLGPIADVLEPIKQVGDVRILRIADPCAGNEQ